MRFPAVMDLILMGVWPRLALALVFMALLWLGFFWATAPVGGV